MAVKLTFEIGVVLGDQCRPEGIGYMAAKLDREIGQVMTHANLKKGIHYIYHTFELRETEGVEWE